MRIAVAGEFTGHGLLAIGGKVQSAVNKKVEERKKEQGLREDAETLRDFFILAC